MIGCYALIDSGGGEKLERFGDYLLIRPAASALWRPQLSEKEWERADARFTREQGSRWLFRRALPSSWEMEIEGIRFKISPTEFGHLGVFPEHQMVWKEMVRLIDRPLSFLNLFAYSGGASLFAARAGAKVCHLDASKGMVDWARKNAQLNQLQQAPIRWIVEDVHKFLQREIKRGITYDGILLDPPSFGRGSKGEVFKIERDLPYLLDLCRKLLSQKPAFFCLTSHTPGLTPLVLQYLLEQSTFDLNGECISKEMLLPSEQGFALPSGSFALWRPVK